jgi:hypothetical protein
MGFVVDKVLLSLLPILIPPTVPPGAGTINQTVGQRTK